MSGKDLSHYLVEGDIGRGLTPEASQKQFEQQNAHMFDEFSIPGLDADLTVDGGVDAAMDDESCPSGACKI